MKLVIKSIEEIIVIQKSCSRLYGDYCDGVHLFPFRTEKLSPSAPMVLP